jgi:hypothetical protein
MKIHGVHSLGFLIGLAFCTSSPVSAQITYLKDQDPTADISHTTVESVPGPTDRLTVGIKEQVSCSINNWKDPDIAVNGSAQAPISDNYGTINWAASNGGSCVPAMGPATTYTACESGTDTAETVTMTADDSNTLGNDDAIDVTLDFTVLVPKTHELPAVIDSNPGHPPAGTNNVGASTYFRPQHGPLTVSFKRVSFRENYPEATQYWPDGSANTRAGATPGYTVASRNGQPNFWMPLDNRTAAKRDKAKLLAPGAVAPNYSNAEMVYSVPLEFQANGTWHPFTDPPAFYKFYANLTAKTSFDTTYGSLQGPWQ